MPGEFERQTAILLGTHEMVLHVPELFADVAKAIEKNVLIWALVNNEDERRTAIDVLRSQGVSLANIHFIYTPHNTMWIRDYGPTLVVAQDGRSLLVDADYECDIRPDDDDVPIHLGARINVPVAPATLKIDGGNLLSNGQGLFLATRKLLEDNIQRGLTEQQVCRGLQAAYGARQIVFLDPLAGESTGHVDMFATFTSANTVVVGEYPSHVDEENAAILDLNAERLKNVRIQQGRLRVVRIPMPPHDDDVWRTYTNVVYANQVVLLPVYPDIDLLGERQARLTLSRLLPNRRVVPINGESLAALGGALHCVTMNIGPLGLGWRLEAPMRPLPGMRPVENEFFNPLLATPRPWRVSPAHATAGLE